MTMKSATVLSSNPTFQAPGDLMQRRYVPVGQQRRLSMMVPNTSNTFNLLTSKIGEKLPTSEKPSFSVTTTQPHSSMDGHERTATEYSQNKPSFTKSSINTSKLANPTALTKLSSSPTGLVPNLAVGSLVTSDLYHNSLNTRRLGETTALNSARAYAPSGSLKNPSQYTRAHALKAPLSSLTSIGRCASTDNNTDNSGFYTSTQRFYPSHLSQIIQENDNLSRRKSICIPQNVDKQFITQKAYYDKLASAYPTYSTGNLSNISKVSLGKDGIKSVYTHFPSTTTGQVNSFPLQGLVPKQPQSLSFKKSISTSKSPSIDNAKVIEQTLISPTLCSQATTRTFDEKNYSSTSLLMTNKNSYEISNKYISFYVETEKLQHFISTLQAFSTEFTLLKRLRNHSKERSDDAIDTTSKLTEQESKCLESILLGTGYSSKPLLDSLNECIEYLSQYIQKPMSEHSQHSLINSRICSDKNVTSTSLLSAPNTMNHDKTTVSKNPTVFYASDSKRYVISGDTTQKKLLTEPALYTSVTLDKKEKLMPNLTYQQIPNDLRTENQTKHLKKSSFDATSEYMDKEAANLQQTYLYSLQLETVDEGQTVTRCVDVIRIFKSPTVLLMTEFLTLQECEKIKQLHTQPYLTFDARAIATSSASSEEHSLNILHGRLAAILKINKEDVQKFIAVIKKPREIPFEHRTPYNAATVLIFLNDVSEGGILELKNHGLQVTPRCGTAIVWLNTIEDRTSLISNILVPDAPLYLLLCQLRPGAMKEQTELMQEPKSVDFTLIATKLNTVHE